MADLMATGQAWLADQLKEHVSRTITYKRANQSFEIELQATIGQTRFEISDELGNQRTEWTDRDYLILAADLLPSGDPPARGDEIRETVGGTIYKYEVMPLGAEPAWRWSDPFRTMIRVHCKEVKQTDVVT